MRQGMVVVNRIVLHVIAVIETVRVEAGSSCYLEELSLLALDLILLSFLDFFLGAFDAFPSSLVFLDFFAVSSSLPEVFFERLARLGSSISDSRGLSLELRRLDDAFSFLSFFTFLAFFFFSGLRSS